MGLFDFLKKKSQQDIKNDDTTLRMAQEKADQKEDKKPEEPETPVEDSAPDTDINTDSGSSFDD